MRPCLSSPLKCCSFWRRLLLHFRVEVVVQVGEDWKDEQDCVIDDPHPLFGMPQAEDEHVKDCGDEEDDEDSEGCHEGGLGKCQWVGCLTKLAMERIFNAEATPVDIENIPQTGAGLVWYEHDIVHQALHCHVQAVGLDQHLSIRTKVIKLKFCGEENLGEDEEDSFEEGEGVEALYKRLPTPSQYPEIYLQRKERVEFT